MTPPLKKPEQPAADSITELLQNLMMANLTSAVLAGYFVKNNAANAPGFLDLNDALEYAKRLQDLAMCEKEMSLLASQVKDMHAAFTLRHAFASSYRNIGQGLPHSFKGGLGVKLEIYELSGVAESNLRNLALARKNLDPQKINMALEALKRPQTAPLMADKALASKLNL